MRARSAIGLSSLAAVLALANGCRPADEPVEIEPSLAGPAATSDPRLEVELEHADAQDRLADLLRNVQHVRTDAPGPGAVRQSDMQAAPGDVIPQTVQRLVFQCSDDVTFAVRMAGSYLEVTPPGTPHGFLRLLQTPAESGLRYAAPGATFRSEGDRATLEIGRERYVDCVSNPASTVWETAPRTGSPIR